MGGVLVDLDPTWAGKTLSELGITDIKQKHDALRKNGFYRKLDTGEVGADWLRQQLRDLSNREVTNEELDTAWNAMITGFPPERFQLLRDLRRNYHLFLLSNTNEIHTGFVLSEVRKRFGYEFSSLFGKVYFSNEMGRAKPDVETFQFVLTDSGLVGSESLFIDDLPDNCEGAKAAGIHTHHLVRGTQITDLFENGLLKPDILLL